MAEIASVPALKAEAAAVAPALAQIAAPVGESEVRRMLSALTLTFREVATEAQADAFWRTYEIALAKCPKSALTAAIHDWVKVGKWFPKPAELLELAEKHAIPMRMAANRAARAAAMTPPKPVNRLPAEKVAALTQQTLQALAGMGSDLTTRTANRQVEGKA